ncbi:MAG TPA: hypothetical protein VF520_15280 [Thermoleophilaceae bacterium]|jgi:hypothetical protein
MPEARQTPDGEKPKARIVPDKATVFATETFDLWVEGEEISRAGVRWSLSDPSAAKLEVGIFDRTAHITQHDPPAAGAVQLRARTKDGHEATAEIKFSVMYPDTLPHPAQLRTPLGTVGKSWSDARGKRGALILLDLMLSTPDELTNSMSPIPIFRIDDRDTNVGFHLPFAPSVFLEEKTFAALDPEAPEWTAQDVVFASTAIHELAHAIEFRYVADSERIGAALADLLKLARPGRTGWVVSEQMVASLYAWWWGDQVLGLPWSYEDFISEWSKVAGWRVRGHWSQALFGMGDRLPTAFTGAGALSPLTGLHHLSGVKLGEIADFDADGNLTSEMVDALRRSGHVSQYAGSDPHEDFAETVTERVLGEAALNKAAREVLMKNAKRNEKGEVTELVRTGEFGYVTKTASGDESHGHRQRRLFLGKHGIYPAAAASVRLGQRIGAGKTLPGYEVFYWQPALAKLTGAAAASAAGRVEVDEEGNVSGGYVAEPEPARERVEAERSFDGIGELAGGWHDDFGEVLDGVSGVLATLDAGEPPDPETEEPEALMRALRSAELHGDGLRRYGGVDDAVARGDVLFDADRTPWVVTGVDERGRVGQVIGARAGRRAGTEARRDRFAYAWRPDSAARRFAPPEGELSPAYADGEAALAELVGLWGLAESDGRTVGTPGGMLAAAVRAAGGRTRDDMKWLEPEEVREYCRSHGTAPGAPGSDGGALVGDLVVLGGGKRVGVLTRIGEDGSTVDVLFGGGPRRGRVGEEPDTVQLEHGLELPAGAELWRPS